MQSCDVVTRCFYLSNSQNLMVQDLVCQMISHLRTRSQIKVGLRQVSITWNWILLVKLIKCVQVLPENIVAIQHKCFFDVCLLCSILFLTFLKLCYQNIDNV